MFVRKIDADNLQENYIKTVIATLKQRPHKPDEPASLRVLQALMQAYLDESGSSVLWGFVPTNAHSHSAQARSCINTIKNEKDPDKALNDILQHIASIKKLNPTGHFATLLNIYFSAFQTYLAKCDNSKDNDANKVRDLVQQQDIWGIHITHWIDQYIQKFRRGENINYEELEQIAQIIPKSKIDDFTDFLLSELEHTRHESQNGLHHGWVCVALGEMAGKVSWQKRAQISSKLTEIAAQTKDDLSVVGACHALGTKIGNDRLAVNPDARKRIANRIVQFTIDNLDNKADLFGDHHSNTVKLFMQKTFSALARLEDDISQGSRDSILGKVLNPQHAYAFRSGLLLLEEWISDQAKLTFLDSLSGNKSNGDKQRLTILTLLWPWFDSDSNKKTAWQKCRSFDSLFTHARNLLMLKRQDRDSFQLHDELALNVKLLTIRDDAANKTVRAATLENLMEVITAENLYQPSIQIQALDAMAQALKSGWLNKKYQNDYAKILYDYCMKETNPEIKLHAASTALILSDHLMLQQYMNLRDVLLNGLDNDNPQIRQKAGQFLAVYAKTAPLAYLPELMTYLLVKPDNISQLLLASTYQQYCTETLELQNKNALKV